MKKNMIKKITSSIISISILTSALGAASIADAATNSARLYSDPNEYITDGFAQAQALGTEERRTDTGATVTTASGWDVTGGGYTEGKNSGGKFNLVDNSSSSAVQMRKTVPAISGGMVKWEFSATHHDVESTFTAQLLADDGAAVAEIVFDKGSVKFSSGGTTKVISSYSRNTQKTIIAYLNMKDNVANVTAHYSSPTWAYRHTVTDDGNVFPIAPNKTITSTKIISTETETGSIQINLFRITKDYITRSDFYYHRIAPDWETAGVDVNGALLLNVKSLAQTDVSKGDIQENEKYEVQYRFNTDELVDTKLMDIQAGRDYSKNILPSSYANCNSTDIGSQYATSSTYKYSLNVVTDNNAPGKDTSVVKITGTNNSSQYRSMLFSYTKTGISDLLENPNLNLSFYVKKSEGLELSYKDANHDILQSLKAYSIVINVNGKVVNEYRNTPAITDSLDWQHMSFSFKLNEAAIKAAITDPETDKITFSVYVNDTSNRKVNGSIYLDDISLSQIFDSDSVMSIGLTSDGKITATAKGKTVNIADYRAGMWQNIRAVYDRNTGMATIRHNHLNEAQIEINNIFPENLIFTNNSQSGIITVDDVRVKKVQDEPIDYVPVPVVPADDGYYSSLLSCALWSESGGRGWDAISGFDERTPIIGFYDEGKPEVSDWEIKWMVEHGIDSQIFCWFHDDINNNGGAIPAFKNAKYSDMLDYSLMWTNTGSQYIASKGEKFQNLFKNTYVPYWIYNYFKDNNYTKIDNKPVLYIFSGAELIEYLGGGNVEIANEQLDYLNEECKKAGFDGVKIFVYNGANVIDGDDVVGSFTYGYNDRNAASLDSKYSGYSSNTCTFLPVLGLHHNTEAWSGNVDQFTTPAEYEQLAIKLKSMIDSGWNYSNMYENTTINGRPNQKLLVVDNWNELGEGHYLMPTKTFGFTYLDIFRKVFSPNAGSHTDTYPTENQKKRINQKYDQTRLRRSGANTSSSDIMNNIVELWDFTKADPGLPEGASVGGFHTNKLIYTSEGIKSTTKNVQTHVGVGGISIDVDATGIDTVYFKVSENIDQASILFQKMDDLDSSGNLVDANPWSKYVWYNADHNGDIVKEFAVYMGNHAEWNGTINGVYIKIPVKAGDSFTLQEIGLAKNNFFEVGEELIKYGSFEKGTSEIEVSGVSTEFTHFDFNRGAASVKVTGNGIVKIPVTDLEENGSYRFEAFAKLPFESTSTNSSLTAQLSYKVNGVAKTSDALILPKFLNQGYAKLGGTFEINELEDVSDVAVNITNIGDNTYYLDDVSLRKYSPIYTYSDSYENDIRNGIKIEFNEDITVDDAEAVCKSTGETLTVSKLAKNTALVSLPKESVGKETVFVSGIKTKGGNQNAGLVSLDIYSGVDGITEDYYTADGDYLEASEFSAHAGETIIGYLQISNSSQTNVSGKVILAFYNGNKLLSVASSPFDAKGEYPGEVELEIEIPERFTDYKIFIWSDENEPLFK